MNSQSQQGSNTLVIVLVVLGLLGVGVLIVFAICGGLAYFSFQSAGKSFQSIAQQIEGMVAAESTAQGFLNDIKGGRLGEAYASTSPKFRQEQDQEDFETFVEQHPGLKQHQVASLTATGTPTQQAVQFQVTIIPAKGDSVTATIYMVKVDNVWQVERFTIP